MQIFEACPNITDTRNCTCSVHSLDVGDHGLLKYHALVNCSNQSMTSFPKKLPSATRLLDISHNDVRLKNRVLRQSKCSLNSRIRRVEGSRGEGGRCHQIYTVGSTKKWERAEEREERERRLIAKKLFFFPSKVKSKCQKA